MVTKTLFENPILCFIFVLLESSGGYGATSEAFIFSLNNSEALAPFMSKVKPGKARRAIDRHSFYGPKFGQDLVIFLDANTFQVLKSSFGPVLRCSILSEGQGLNPEGTWTVFLT